MMKYIRFNFDVLPRIMYAHKCTIRESDFKKRKNGYFELTIVHEGEIKVTLKNQSFIIKKNMFSLMPADEEYTSTIIGSSCQHSCVAFFVDVETEVVEKDNIIIETFDNTIKTQIEPIYVPIFGTITDQNINAKMMQLIDIKNKQNEAKNLLYGISIINLLSSLAYFPLKTDSLNKEQLYCFKVDKFLENNYSDPNINLNMIADSVKLHPNYLCNIYKKITNKTINQKLIEIRIEEAKKIMSLNKYHIKDISTMVGILNHNYFSVYFRKYTGFSPEAYIRNNY